MFLFSGNDLISGGEDGVVNIWDIRDKQVTNKIEPHKNNKISRSDLGEWIGAVSINEDWVVCFKNNYIQIKLVLHFVVMWRWTKIVFVACAYFKHFHNISN